MNYRELRSVRRRIADGDEEVSRLKSRLYDLKEKSNTGNSSKREENIK